MTTPSDGDLIAQFMLLKTHVEIEEAKVKEALKPFKDAMTTIRTEMGVRLVRNKAQNTSTEDGTAYLRHDEGMKVDNGPAFLKFVTDNNRWDLLEVEANQKLVIEYACADRPGGSEGETVGPPPGISFNPSVTCIIRR